MVLSTKFCLMNIFHLLLIDFLIARKCVTDVYDVVYDDVMMTCKKCIFCIRSGSHLTFDFILRKEIDIFKSGFSYSQLRLLVILFFSFSV